MEEHFRIFQVEPSRKIWNEATWLRIFLYLWGRLHALIIREMIAMTRTCNLCGSPNTRVFKYLHRDNEVREI